MNPSPYSPGDRIGKLTLLSREIIISLGRKIWCWKCRCECGVEKTVRPGKLNPNASCGCVHKIRLLDGSYRRTHGMRRSPEYIVWASMIRRCEDPNCRSYRYYGERGIRVCTEWKKSFEAFIEDVGRRPDPTFSIDRIRSDGDYEPNNVRWASPIVQVGNRRNTVYVDCGTERLTLADTARRLDISYKAAHKRLSKGTLQVKDLKVTRVG